ncbi:MAG: TolC family protein, partial [Spirochaetes bacterium]|nr:TolC family protein [Spirochaetota bacterium]
MNNKIRFRKMKTLTGLIIILLILPYNIKAQEIVTLERAIEMALRNNPGIKAGESQIKEAEAKYTQAYSTFLPQADALSKYFYTNNLPGMYPLAGTSVPVLNNGAPTGDNIIMHPMAPYPDLARDVMTIDFNLIYPVYAGNKRKNAVSSTIDLKKAYTQDLDETKGQTILNVKTVFYNILFINELLKVYQESLNQMNEHLALAEKAYSEGVRSEFDVLSFKNKIEEFKSKIIEIEGNREVAMLGLKNLIVIPDSSDVQCIGNIASDALLLRLLNYQNTDSIVNKSYKMQYLKSMKQVLDKKAKIEAAENLPVLFAFGNYHVYHGMDFPPFDDNWRQGYAIGAGLKINLFDGNMSKGKVAEVKAGIEKLDNYQDGLKLKLNYEIQKSFKNIESFTAQKLSAENNLKVAIKAYEIA